MEKEHLDTHAAVELIQRQEALQAEAQQLIVHLDLFTVLSNAGKPEQIGSTVSGLMVWRDIDFNILCSHRSLPRVIQTMRPLLTHPHTTKLHYTNESGEHRPTELHGDDRYYFVLYYEMEKGKEWKIDLSFWLSEKPRDQLAHLAYLSERLTEETRIAILWIKDIWHRFPRYPYQISGIDIYDAVLEHGVRTPTQFEVYLIEQGRFIGG
jgi:hypothetical protein